MDFVADLTRIRSLPRAAISKAGQPVEIRLLEESLHPALLEMYLAYQPRNSFQGLPPIKDEVCVKWVQQMIATGVNVVSTSCAGAVEGHIAVFPINPQKCEMLVVVSPAQQNHGIGTQLVRTIVEVAHELGFERIWLPVAASNLRARHVYKKCGFEYTLNKQARELDMVLELKDHQARLVASPTAPAIVRAD